MLRGLRDLWTLIPTPARARRVRLASVEKVLKRHRIRRINAEQVLQILQTIPIPVADRVQEAATANAVHPWVRAFVDFMSTIQNSGYSIAHGVLNAADYGVPQSRKRLILLASRLGKTHLPPPEIPLHPKTVRDAIGGLPPIPAGGRCDLDQLHPASELSPVNLERIRTSISGKSWRDWPPPSG